MLIPFRGVVGCCCWSQSQPCLRARAGYSLDKSPAHHRALTDEQCGVQCSRTLRYAAQPCPELGLEPATFWSLVDLLYPLSYSRPTPIIYWSIFFFCQVRLWDTRYKYKVYLLFLNHKDLIKNKTRFDSFEFSYYFYSILENKVLAMNSGVLRPVEWSCVVWCYGSGYVCH